MARYIDADKIVITELESNNKSKRFLDINNHCFITRNSKSIDTIISYVSKIIKDAPAEDVVPKSEVEGWKETAEAYQKQFEESYEKHQKEVEGLKKENEILSASNKTLALSRRGIETELIKAKQDVAREIFEEIENYILTCIENDEKVYDKGNDEYYDGRFMGFKIIEEHIAELKKKYIGE